MRPVTVSVGPLAAGNATNIRTASNATAGAMVLDGALVVSGVAILDAPRQILFTTAASEAGHTVLLSGVDRAGNLQSETITLPSSATTVASVLSYKTVTSAVISANSNDKISIGTNGVGESQWVRLDEWANQKAGLQVDVSGTVNYTVRTSYDDPNSPTNPVAAASMTWFDSTDSSVVSATAAKQSSLDPVPIYVKLVLNSSTSPGFATMTVSQYGVSPR